jgi:hypothetical protein
VHQTQLPPILLFVGTKIFYNFAKKCQTCIMSDYRKGFNRLNKILSIIRNNTANLEELTELVNEILKHENEKVVSERTIARDIIALKSKGYEIKTKKGFENKNYYVIQAEDNYLDFLSENDKRTLPIMMGLLKTEDNLSIVNWLKGLLNRDYNFSLKELDPSPYFVKTSPSINFKEELMLLTTEIISYIKNEQAILFAYKEPQNYKNVAPLQVRYFDGRYYLLGIEFDDENNYETKNELITYSIDNIIEKKITPAIKEIDGFDDELIYFNYNKLYKESHLEILMEYSLGIMYNRIYKRNKVKKYRFKFTGWAISYIANKKFHPSQKTIEKNNDYIIIELTLWEIMDTKLFDEQGIEVWDNKEVDFFVERFEDKCERLN